MDFSLSEIESETQEVFRKFADERLAPRAAAFAQSIRSAEPEPNGMSSIHSPPCRNIGMPGDRIVNPWASFERPLAQTLYGLPLSISTARRASSASSWLST